MLWHWKVLILIYYHRTQDCIDGNLEPKVKRNICKCDTSKIYKWNKWNGKLQDQTFKAILSEPHVFVFSHCSLTSDMSLDAAKERARRCNWWGRGTPSRCFYNLPAMVSPSFPPSPRLDHEWGLAHLFQTWKVWQEVGDSCILCPKQHPTSTEFPSVLPILLFLTWCSLVSPSVFQTFLFSFFSG